MPNKVVPNNRENKCLTAGDPFLPKKVPKLFNPLFFHPCEVDKVIFLVNFQNLENKGKEID